MQAYRKALATGVAVLALVGAAGRAGAAGPSQTPAPQIVGQNGHFALMVDGAPFLMLGAQMNNSSAWPSMLPKVWPVIDRIHANTLEAPIAWEQIEAKEGQFDFSFLDTLLVQAREHHVRLVLLWFGTWKNNGPNYAPEWVKLDNARFPRVITARGETRNSLSPLYPATLDADRKAFVALMTHLKAADPQHTVIMVQVENETGVYGAVRDHSPAAEAAFKGAVPDPLIRALGKTPGTWAEVFGADADEFFYAWAIAHFVDQVAAAGKAVNPLPLYVNAALRDPAGYQDPLSFSSGGPTWDVLDIWKATASHIDVVAPDIYMRDDASYARTLDQYSRADNALMAPETGNDQGFAHRFFEVIGHRALGFSPFGMDDTGYYNYPLGAAKLDEATLESFAQNYALVGPFARQLAALSYAGKVWGASEPSDTHVQQISLGDWQVSAAYGLPQFGSQPPAGNPTPSGGFLVAELGPNEYLVTGYHVRLSFDLARPDGRKPLYARVEEGHYEHGQWVFDRLWNGDQTDYGLNFTSRPQLLRVRLATY